MTGQVKYIRYSNLDIDIGGIFLESNEIELFWDQSNKLRFYYYLPIAEVIV